MNTIYSAIGDRARSGRERENVWQKNDRKYNVQMTKSYK